MGTSTDNIDAGINEMTQPTVSDHQVSAALMIAASYVARGWCKNRNAIDRDRKPVKAVDPSACKWCAEGAVIAAIGGRDGAKQHLFEECRRFVQRAVKTSMPLHFWNDMRLRRKHQVIAALVEASAIAKAEGR